MVTPPYHSAFKTGDKIYIYANLSPSKSHIPIMAAIQFRNATQNDLNRVVEIYNSTIASRMVTADTEPVTVESRQKWFDEHDPQKRPLWIIENTDGKSIGWVSFQSFYGRPAYDATVEISIYLDAKERGKGLGKEILNSCIEKAKKIGIKTLLGFIFSHNTPSLKLFRHAGFEEWGHLPNIAVLDGEEKGLSILGKRIA
jgi:L-amino acid N-acyltransferase YncA